ncbi:MAG TPA: hypothetical protein VFD88_07555 [Clostridia bacterium]|nr:hypothetical protein [Clostridia bacterium]
MRRVIRLLERCLPALACLSGAVVPLNAMIGDGPESDPAPGPDLDAQMREIVDFVALQEQRWRPRRRTTDPLIHQSRKPRRS